MPNLDHYLISISTVGGVFVLGTVIWTYTRSRLKGRWPVGHPWSGVMLTSLGLANLLPMTPYWYWPHLLLCLLAAASGLLFMRRLKRNA